MDSPETGRFPITDVTWSNRVVQFIINPKAGSGKSNSWRGILEKTCLDQGQEAIFHETEAPGHATSIAQQLKSRPDAVYAVGGDGTVREVAEGLMHGIAPLGIIPVGSGNGLARHLGIPMDPRQALIQLLSVRSTVKPMDLLSVNGKLSANIAGVGFDGTVAEAFSKHGSRGLNTYVRLALRHYRRSGEFRYIIETQDQSMEGQAWIVAFANGSQYGNNAAIAEGAISDDGLMDVVFIRRPSLLQVPGFAWKVMTGKVRKSKLVTIRKTSSLEIKTDQSVFLHLDGEAAGECNELKAVILPGALNVLLPGPPGS